MALPLIPLVVRGVLWGVGLLCAGYTGKKVLEKTEKDYFNNGVCKKCGGHFKYIEGTEMKGNKGYKCDVCDNCVWIAFGTDLDYTYKPSKRE